MKYITLLSALVCTLYTPLYATGSRSAALDNHHGLVPDDYDAVTYYHLNPHFKNHLYLEVQPNGAVQGWSFIDIGIGTLSLWWNKDSAVDPLFDALVEVNNFGYSGTPLDQTPAGSFAHSPLETRLAKPKVNVSLGLGGDPLDGLPLGICVQVASNENERDNDAGLSVAGAPSLAKHLGTSFANNLTVTSWANHQSSRLLMVVPSFGLVGENFSFDAKIILTSTSFDNFHEESVSDGGGSGGTLRQTFRSIARPSWGGKALLRIGGDNMMVLTGGMTRSDLSSEHVLDGGFGGALFTPTEAAGYNYVDQRSDFVVTSWSSLLGWVRTWDEGTLVLAAGAEVSRTDLEELSFGPAAGDTTGADYRAIDVKSRRVLVGKDIGFPLLIGAELEVKDWLTVRGSAEQNVWGVDSDKTTVSALTPAGASVNDTVTKNTRRTAGDWDMNFGLGLAWGQFKLDTVINALWLGSSGTLVNPALTSTAVYEF